MLTVKQLQAKPGKVQRRLADGRGLYLQVKPSGAKSWLFRYTRSDGQRSWIGLGAYPDRSVQRARAMAEEFRALLADGIDPQAHREAQEQAAEVARRNSFAHWANRWFAHKLNKGWAASTAEKCDFYMQRDILPVLGERPIADIRRAELNALMAGIEDRGAFNVAEKSRQWLRAIFSFAIAHDAAEVNPASELAAVAKKAPAVQHYPHLKERELPEFLRALRAQDNGSDSALVTTTAAWLVLLTGSRPGMVRFAQWAEFELDGALWVIPAERMKMRRAHSVPLSRQLVAMLRRLHDVTGQSEYLFPGRGGYGKRDGSVMSEGTIKRLFDRMGYRGRMSAHGSRHMASTILNEYDYNPRWVDAQLSHAEVEGPKVRGEYNHAIYLPQRREMMQWYADHLAALENGTDKVRSISGGRTA